MGRVDKTQSKLTFEQRRAKSQDPVRTPEGARHTPERERPSPDIRELLVTMEKNLQSSISALGTKVDALTYRMDRMAERIDKHAGRLDVAEQRIVEVEEAQTTLDSDSKQLNTLVKTLQDKTEDLEARSRRCNLRLTGLPETTHTGIMELFVEKLLITLLGEGVFSPMFVVERAHRSLGPRPPEGAPPRPIIAKLLNYRDRDAALRLAREKHPLRYEGSTISLYPDFTIRVQEARKQFAPLKKQLKDMGVDYAMLYPARLRVNRQGRSHIFTDVSLLRKSIKNWAKDHRPDLEHQKLDLATGGPLDEND